MSGAVAVFNECLTSDNGGPERYGVEVLQWTESEAKVKFKFKSGVEYCCFELGCHLDRNRLRDAAVKLGQPLPPTVNFLVEIENGAVYQIRTKSGTETRTMSKFWYAEEVDYLDF